MNSCLIITSCIYPFSSFVGLKDPKERELLHISALKRWIIESDFSSIIICDNSNYVYTSDLVKLALLYDKKLEILSFKAEPENGLKYGKGFSEGELMKYIISNSKIIHNYESFFKVTGKLFVENFILMNSFEKSDFVFAFPIIFKGSNKNIEFVHTTFYFAKLEAFKTYLLDSYLNVRDSEGLYLEHVYGDSLKNIKNSNKKIVIKPMLPPPIVVGVSGSSGEFYGVRSPWKSKMLVVLFKIFLLKRI